MDASFQEYLEKRRQARTNVGSSTVLDRGFSPGGNNTTASLYSNGIDSSTLDPSAGSAPKQSSLGSWPTKEGPGGDHKELQDYHLEPSPLHLIVNEWKNKRKDVLKSMGVLTREEMENFFLGKVPNECIPNQSEHPESSGWSLNDPVLEPSVDPRERLLAWVTPCGLTWESPWCRVIEAIPIRSGSKPALSPYAEDGLYDPASSAAAVVTSGKLISRFRSDWNQGRVWLDESGQLKQVHSIQREPTRTQPPFFPPAVKSPAPLDPLVVDSVKDLKNIEGSFKMTIDLKIQEVLFDHHPLFNLEQVLVSQARALFQSYLPERDRQLSDYYTNRIEGIHQTIRDQLKQSIDPNVSLRNKDLAQSCLQIKKLRLVQDENELVFNNLQSKILALWNEIVELRQNQGFCSTVFRVVLSIRPTVVDEDLERYCRAAEIELECIRWLNRWNVIQTSVLQTQSQLTPSSDETGPVQNQPHLSPVFSEEGTVNDIKDRLLKCRRAPGDPIYILDIADDFEITADASCPRAEQARRRVVAATSYTHKVFINDHEVSSTHLRSLQGDRLVYNELHHILLSRSPRAVKVQCVESRGHTPSSVLYEVFVPIHTDLPGHSRTLEVEFSSPKTVMHPYAVGSGVCLPQQSSLSGQVLYTSGRLVIEVGCRDQAGSQCTKSRMHTLSAVGLMSKTDGPEVTDPNSPEPVMESVTTRVPFSQTEPFNMDALGKLCDLVDQETGIPAAQVYKRGKAEGVISSALKSDGLPPLDNSELFLLKIKEKLWRLSEMALQQKSLEDMVTTLSYQPVWALLSSAVSDFLRPRRPLRPFRQTEKKDLKGLILPELQSLSVEINIAFGRGFPSRILPQVGPMNLTYYMQQQQQQSRALNTLLSTSMPTVLTTMSSQLMTNVDTSVEAGLLGSCASSSCSAGSHPIWNERLALKAIFHESESDGYRFQMLNEKVTLDFFDQLIYSTEAGQNAKTLSSQWIGCLELPIYRLMERDQVDGTLPITIPPVLLMYKVHGIETNQLAPGLQHLNRPDTRVQLCVSLNPAVLLPSEPVLEFRTEESPDVVRLAMDLNTKHQARKYKVLATDINGLSIVVSRYIQPQAPPAELLEHYHSDKMKTMMVIARYVSLIPQLADAVQFPNIGDIWFTTEQFLLAGSGDEEEHAVLLCNFFLWLGVQAYVVMGYSLVEGSTSWVLSLSGESRLLWNCLTGKPFSPADSCCPLLSVNSVFSADQIWLNMQKDSQPSKTNWDFSHQTSWMPFFPVGLGSPSLSSIQTAGISFTAPDSTRAAHIKDSLEKTLRDAFMEWRPLNVTRWNRFLIRLLKEQLAKFEDMYAVNELNSESQYSLISMEFPRYQIFGFALQSSLDTEERLVAALKRTRLHETRPDEDVEFGLAVSVTPYPQSVFAVWIYAVKLTRSSVR